MLELDLRILLKFGALNRVLGLELDLEVMRRPFQNWMFRYIFEFGRTFRLQKKRGKCTRKTVPEIGIQSDTQKWYPKWEPK